MTREFLFLASIVLFHQRRFTGDMPILLADVGSSDRILANDFIAKGSRIVTRCFAVRECVYHP